MDSRFFISTVLLKTLGFFHEHVGIPADCLQYSQRLWDLGFF